MKIIIDIPEGQEDVVLDAFADPGDSGRSEEVVTRKVTQIIALQVLQTSGRKAAQEAVNEQKAMVEAAFGVDLPAPQHGQPGPQGQLGGPSTRQSG